MKTGLRVLGISSGKDIGGSEGGGSECLRDEKEDRK